MVQAILAGNKTQTRRVFKQVECRSCKNVGEIHKLKKDGSMSIRPCPKCHGETKCAYGKVGDRLWVRETWATKIKTVGNTPHEAFTYRATEPNAVACYDCNGNELPVKWKPSIFMPRAASRILLEITGVRVERLHSISKQDAIAKGIKAIKVTCSRDGDKTAYKAYDWPNENITKNNPIDSYFSLWESINGRESLDANPWVWVITFKVVEIKQ